MLCWVFLHVAEASPRAGTKGKKSPGSDTSSVKLWAIYGFAGMEDASSWYRGSRLVIEEFAADSSGRTKCPNGGSPAAIPRATLLAVNPHASSKSLGMLTRSIRSSARGSQWCKASSTEVVNFDP